jgi:DNA-binding XRE family transcriptional regulator
MSASSARPLIRDRVPAQPSQVAATGGAVTFSPSARKTGSASRWAHFTYILPDGLGLSWAGGSTAEEQLDGTLRTFNHRLRLTGSTTAVAFVVTVEVVLLDGPGGAVVSSTDNGAAWISVGGSLGGLIAAHRTTHDLTQADLGETLGVSRSWISDLEHGADPSLELFEKIAETLEAADDD